MKVHLSALGRLLHEISWEGKRVRKYRHGGLGLENVLTVEVFETLNFLPRTEFLGRILRSAEGGNPATLKLLAEQVEHLTVSILPGDVHLAENRPNLRCRLYLQPDAILESPLVYCMLEAKRIKTGTFQPEQLAKEYLAVLQQGGNRSNLLLLVLPAPPPISVKGHGRLALHEAVASCLPQVLERAEGEFPSFNELCSNIDSIVAYTTWQRVYEEVEGALKSFSSTDSSVRGSISRLAIAVLEAISRHGSTQPLLDQGAAKTEVRWVECDGFDDPGHGVQFLHDELQGEDGPTAVAFLEGFEWLQRRGGNPATVRLVTKCPSSITADHWSEITQSSREAVRSFMSNDGNLKCSFRHGPIGIIING